MPDTTLAIRRYPTAIIDVGSNSVRLVVYGHSARAPLEMINERAFCSLGRGLKESGKLNPEGVKEAIATLKRFAWMIRGAGVQETVAFCTAAVRDASDGKDFVAAVGDETGLTLQVLSGAREAQLAGLGVQFGLPLADGVVADLGGSSLELITVDEDGPGEGITLSLGPLQFIGLDDPTAAADAEAERLLRSVDWLSDVRGRNLYLVGGTWRSLAKLDFQFRDYPLNVIHGYEMEPDRTLELAQLVAQQSNESLSARAGISRSRLQMLPSAATVLSRLLRRLQPRKLVFSAHGVREGAYLETLSRDVRHRDPLLDAAADIAAHEARFDGPLGETLHSWMSPLFSNEAERDIRLRMACCLLCETGWRTHPEYRATQSFRRVLRAPLIGVDHRERRFLAAAVLRRYSHKAGGPEMAEAAEYLGDDRLRQAERIGAAMRLALTLSGGIVSRLEGIEVGHVAGRLQLSLPRGRDHLASEAVTARLRNLASLFETEAHILVVE